MKKTEHTVAATFPDYPAGMVLAESVSLKWTGLFVRRYRFPCVVDRFLVPATPEPLISCGLAGTAEFKERDLGEGWLTRKIGPGDIFITRSKTPYEVTFASQPGQALEIVQIHIAVDSFLAALEAVYPGKAGHVEVIDFFGRDEALAHLCFACAEMISANTPGSSKRVEEISRLVAMFVAEKYTDAATAAQSVRGGLPIRQLRKVEDHVNTHLADNIPVQDLANLVGLSPFHFSRVFKDTLGMTPLEFLTRQRMTRAQQLIRETQRSIIEIALEVGYTSPSHFAKVFRRVVGVTPMEFRSSL